MSPDTSSKTLTLSGKAAISEKKLLSINNPKRDISETSCSKVYALPNAMNEFPPLQQYSQEFEGTYLKAGQPLDTLAFQIIFKIGIKQCLAAFNLFSNMYL